MPTLLAVDSAGTAWVRAGDATLSVSPGVLPRVFGLFEGQRVYDTQSIVVAAAPVAPDLDAMHFELDDSEVVDVPVANAAAGEGPQASLNLFSMGGHEKDGRNKPFSLAHLTEGLHTLTISARYTGDVAVTRPLHFDYHNNSASLVSWAADIKPIFTSRCTVCHVTGPGRDLTTFLQHLSNAYSCESRISCINVFPFSRAYSITFNMVKIPRLREVSVGSKAP